MSHRSTPRTRRSALAQLSSAIGAALVLLTPAADARISVSGIYVPTISNFCGAPSMIVEVTICNTDTGSGSYDIDEFLDGGTPPVYACTESFVPDYNILDPVPTSVGAGECKVIRIELFRPDLLDVHSNLCYWIRFTTSNHGTILMGMQLIDSVAGCIDWAFEESAIFIHPLDPVALNPVISNEWFDIISSEWHFEVRRPDGGVDQSVVSLNGMSPGDPVPVLLDLEPGASTMVPLTAEWLVPGAEGIFEVVLVGEVPMAGAPGRGRVTDRLGGVPLVPSDVAAIGIGEVPATVSTDEPEAAPSLDTRLRFTPNPMGPHGVSITLDGAMSTGVVVLDASGRVVRELEWTGGASTLAWDGLNADGRAVAAGVYFVRALAEAGATSGRLVVLP